MSAEEFIGGRMPPPSVGALRMLQEGAHQFDMVDSQSDLRPYRVVILPDRIPLSSSLAEKLNAYVKAGGSILASFESGLDPRKTGFALDGFPVRNVGTQILDAAGNDVRGRVYARNDYAEYILPEGPIGRGMPPTEHVMHMKGMEIEATEGAEVLMEKVKPYFDRTPEHFCSHRQTPSSGVVDGPAVVRKGAILYFSHPVFTQYYENAPRWCRQIVLNALELLLPDPLIRIKAPSTALVTVNEQKQQRRWIVHLLHYIPERRGQAFDVIEDVIPVYGIEVSIRVPDRVRRVTAVPQGQKIRFSTGEGRIHFTVPRLNGHQMISLEF
jgi:hypothetical protein